MADAGTTARTIENVGWLSTLAISPDSTRIATGGQGSTVQVHTLTGDDPPLFEAAVSGSVSALTFSPEGGALAVADHDQVLVHSTAGGGALWTATVAPDESINAVAYTPDGSALLAATDSTVAVLDAGTGKPRGQNITVEEPLIARIDISRDGARVVLAVDHDHGGNHRDTGSARVIKIATAEEISRAHPVKNDDKAVLAAVFSADGRFVLCGRRDTTLLCAADTGAEQWRIEFGSYAMAVDPTGHWLVVGLAEGRAEVLDLDGVKKAETTHDGAVTHVAFASNGRWIASAGVDNVVHVHNVQTDADRYQRADLGEVGAMAFSPDSRWLALAVDSSVVVLDNSSNGQ